jgi:hypothetical protein
MAGAAMALALFEFYVLAKRLQLKPDTAAGFIAAIAIFVVSLFVNDVSLSLLLTQFVIIVLTGGNFDCCFAEGKRF